MQNTWHRLCSLLRPLERYYSLQEGLPLMETGQHPDSLLESTLVAEATLCLTQLPDPSQLFKVCFLKPHRHLRVQVWACPLDGWGNLSLETGSNLPKRIQQLQKQNPHFNPGHWEVETLKLTLLPPNTPFTPWFKKQESTGQLMKIWITNGDQKFLAPLKFKSKWM